MTGATGFLLNMVTIELPAQPRMEIVLRQSYKEAGVVLRIQNSGVYGVRGISPLSDGFRLSTEHSSLAYRIGNDRFAHPTLEKVQESGDNDSSTTAPLAASAFVRSGQTRLTIDDGVLSAGDAAQGSIAVAGRTRLEVDVAREGTSVHYEEEYPGNLAYADVIGIDSHGFIFLEVQTYLAEIPLQIQREVVVVSPAGACCSRLILPIIRYCTTERDLQIDATGRLYHLMTDETTFTIACWDGLTEGKSVTLSYPAEYKRIVHFNEVAGTTEPHDATKSLPKTTVSSRTDALRIAESYILHRYTCSAANLSPVDVTGLDGDVVRTPSWLMTGRNAHVPYMWGGFNTLAQFDAGLANGRYAGDINTAGVSSYAVGVDCSGFVSRCWQLASHYATSSMPSITTQYASWDLLKPGDGILKSGHVRLFVDRTANGALRVAESSARDWGVSYWTYAPGDLVGVYVPVSCNQMEEQYSTRRPEILSAVNSGGKHLLTWKCDTTHVAGYRLYQSTDGSTWTRLLDESTLKTPTASVSGTEPCVSYRVTSVIDSTGSPESDWSNAVTAGVGTASGTVLIIDGFSRETGSWRGPGHCFAVSYGMSIAASGYSIETAKRSLIDGQSISLQAYKGVIWIAGDQSTLDTVINKAERDALKQYLEGGGCLLITGSEIGWALVPNGSLESRKFYNDYLRAAYVADNAGSNAALGTSSSLFKDYQGISFGQRYAEDYPDEIGASGSILCMKYANGKGAGVSYSGVFGASSVEGKMVYLAFPLETIADESIFSGVVTAALTYFFSPTSAAKHHEDVPVDFALRQNYPNPFNPSTIIEYQLPASNFVTLRLFDVLGREVRTLVAERQNTGSHSVTLNAMNLPSGVYFYRLDSGTHSEMKKMVLLK